MNIKSILIMIMVSFVAIGCGLMEDDEDSGSCTKTASCNDCESGGVYDSSLCPSDEDCFAIVDPGSGSTIGVCAGWEQDPIQACCLGSSGSGSSSDPCAGWGDVVGYDELLNFCKAHCDCKYCSRTCELNGW